MKLKKHYTVKFCNRNINSPTIVFLQIKIFIYEIFIFLTHTDFSNKKENYFNLISNIGPFN